MNRTCQSKRCSREKLALPINKRDQHLLRLFNAAPALLLMLTMVVPFCGSAEETNKPTSERSKFPCPENEIARYTARRVSEPITIDGRLDEPVWTNAPWSPSSSAKAVNHQGR